MSHFRPPVAVLAFSLLLSLQAGADEPLPQPERYEVKSARGHFMAVSVPGGDTKILEAESRRELWLIPGWHRSIFVADDGRHAVTGPDGLNLLPLDFDENAPLFSFWQAGVAVKSINAKQFLPKSALQRTVSHYHWGTVEGIDTKNRLVIRRADGKVFRFNVATGEQQ